MISVSITSSLSTCMYMFSDSEEDALNNKLEGKIEYITSLSKVTEEKRKKPTERTEQNRETDGVERFEVETSEAKNIKKKPVSVWGLEVRKKQQKSSRKESNSVPILLRNRSVEIEKCKSEGERFAVDLNSRPSEPTNETYSKMPVEDFGSAMLRGMGWTGPNSDNKSSNAPIKYVPRPERLGLGASEIQDSSELKQRKPIEQSLGLELSKEEEKRMKQLDQKKSNKPLELLQTHANFMGIDETAPKRIKLQVSIGSRIFISDGEHSGLKGFIKNESKDGKSWIVELEINEQNVLVLKSHVKRYDPTGEVKPTSVSNSDNNIVVSADDLWVCTGLKVKLKSKSFMNGRYYNRKGIILDVLNDSTCTIKLVDSGNEIVYKVPQRILETCLPRVADPSRPTVKYLKKDRGHELFHAPCRVLEFDDERGRAVVQVDDNLEIVFEARYDDICEFVR